VPFRHQTSVPLPGPKIVDSNQLQHHQLLSLNLPPRWILPVGSALAAALQCGPAAPGDGPQGRGPAGGGPLGHQRPLLQRQVNTGTRNLTQALYPAQTLFSRRTEIFQRFFSPSHDLRVDATVYMAHDFPFPPPSPQFRPPTSGDEHRPETQRSMYPHHYLSAPMGAWCWSVRRPIGMLPSICDQWISGGVATRNHRGLIAQLFNVDLTCAHRAPPHPSATVQSPSRYIPSVPGRTHGWSRPLNNL